MAILDKNNIQVDIFLRVAITTKSTWDFVESFYQRKNFFRFFFQVLKAIKAKVDFFAITKFELKFRGD
jgi:hypothetical protein